MTDEKVIAEARAQEWLQQRGCYAKGYFSFDDLQPHQLFALWGEHYAAELKAENEKAHALAVQSHSLWLLFMDERKTKTPEELAKSYLQWWDATERAESAERQLAEASHELNNLLAVIHRDGGHYVSEHGKTKAVEDATKLSSSRIGLLQDANRMLRERQQREHDGHFLSQGPMETCPAQSCREVVRHEEGSK
jgi:hypothetical protein